MLKCKDVSQRASEYLDGADRPLKWQMRLHLAMCSNCRRFVRHLALTRDLASKVGDVESCSQSQSRKIVQKLRNKS
ncbi:zf-HC2 domain-containing protein [Gilvimarinus sp. SDUM040013]|uniref:Zf-HC2 domain-containing protein n=1 Tax=Gilvimarinus gilvus TaxID=3058038 RepID=A0ABU4RTC1_9GAMM|nr:zf-HC2 domain-containing protein [Gilvimarinus sp. SDUM040013]MDO3386978.1 zf-HC2 domain-containing protein [Gilvimarinus sp. SDUM040013]MDX6848128.1 zf-HC2 domain-containing protein [Gilvimarinus sp. SDUM040013]